MTKMWYTESMKKFFSFFLCLTFLAGLLKTPAYADTAWPTDISIQADGGIVIDARSGAVLYGKNIHESYFPASITKILTALIIIENCDLDDTVTFSHTAVHSLEANATILGARAGDKLSVRDCLYALLLQSANEVANALAEHCSGSIEEFAELMNRKAESLGCTGTHFANPSGLNNENHYTTAYDMALIAKAAFDNPVFVEIDKTTYYDVPPGTLQQYPDGWRYYTHHKMLKKSDAAYYNGILGGKTGYTILAGNTLVTCAEREDLKLIAVVLNGHSTHYDDTKKMLDFGFKNFKSISIAEKDSTYEKVENDLTIAGIFPGSAIRLSLDKSSVITLPVNGDFADVTSSLDYSLKQNAPDTAVARIDYMYGERKVGEAYLEANVAAGYTPGLVEMPKSSGLDTGNTIEITAKAQEETFPPNAESVPETEAAPEEPVIPPVFQVLIRVILAMALLAAAAAAVFGFLTYRARKEQRELLERRERREKRRKEWGYSQSEFDLMMQQHVREKDNMQKKRRFFGRF